MIILTGKPGAGKGTQAALLVEKEGYTSISPGEILRERAKTDKALAERMQRGDLVSAAEVNALVEAKLAGLDHNRVILDGYPRDLDQATWLTEYIQTHPPDRLLIVELTVSDDLIHKRLAERGRDDDHADAISHRIQLFHNDVVPALGRLRSHAKSLTVSGEGSIEEVHARLMKVIS